MTPALLTTIAILLLLILLASETGRHLAGHLIAALLCVVVALWLVGESLAIYVLLTHPEAVR
jgi:hypothetical protein